MLKFELSEQHIAIIGAALGKGPYETVAPVITELQKQITAQEAAQKEAVKEAA